MSASPLDVASNVATNGDVTPAMISNPATNSNNSSSNVPAVQPSSNSNEPRSVPNPTNKPPASPSPNPGPKESNRIGYYDMDKVLGEGNFAKVRLATHSLTGQKASPMELPVEIIQTQPFLLFFRSPSRSLTRQSWTRQRPKNYFEKFES